MHPKIHLLFSRSLLSGLYSEHAKNIQYVITTWRVRENFIFGHPIEQWNILIMPFERTRYKRIGFIQATIRANNLTVCMIDRVHASFVFQCVETTNCSQMSMLLVSQDLFFCLCALISHKKKLRSQDMQISGKGWNFIFWHPLECLFRCFYIFHGCHTF